MMSIKKIFALGILLISSLQGWAILPPQYHNANDLKVMMDFIHKYPIDVLGKLRIIDFENKKIIFGDDCVATFVRSQKKPGEPKVGPAAPLILEESSCKVSH